MLNWKEMSHGTVLPVLCLCQQLETWLSPAAGRFASDTPTANPDCCNTAVLELAGFRGLYRQIIIHMVLTVKESVNHMLLLHGKY